MKAKSHYLFGFLGLVLTSLLLIFLNANFFTKTAGKKEKKVVQFDLKKEKNSEVVRRPRPQKQKKSQDLKPNMKSLLKGMSFGIPSLEMDLYKDNDFLANGGFMDGSKVEVQPVVYYKPDIEYPEDALDNGVSGYVIIGVFIDQNGEIQKTDLIESQPKGIFDDVALNNILKWKFKPAKHKGVAVATWQEQKIVFDLDGA